MFKKPQDQPKELPEKYKKKKVIEVLKIFEEKLKKQAKEFQEQASQVARWDRKIFECVELLYYVHKQIEYVDETRKNMEKDINDLKEQQKKFIKELQDKIQAKSNSNDAFQFDSTDQRQKLYETAYNLTKRFKDMEQRLKKIINKKTEGDEDDDSDDIFDNISKIANTHLNALQWIDQQAIEINDKLNLISRKLSNS